MLSLEHSGLYKSTLFNLEILSTSLDTSNNQTLKNKDIAETLAVTPFSVSFLSTDKLSAHPFYRLRHRVEFIHRIDRYFTSNLIATAQIGHFGNKSERNERGHPLLSAVRCWSIPSMRSGHTAHTGPSTEGRTAGIRIPPEMTREPPCTHSQEQPSGQPLEQPPEQLQGSRTNTPVPLHEASEWASGTSGTSETAESLGSEAVSTRDPPPTERGTASFPHCAHWIRTGSVWWISWIYRFWSIWWDPNGLKSARQCISNHHRK